MNRVALCGLLVAGVAGVARASDDGLPDAALRRLAAMKHVMDVGEGEVHEVLGPATEALDAEDAALVEALKREKETRSRAGLRIRRCGLAFVRAELFRRAGEAMPAGSSRQDELFNLATGAFRAMRVEYRDLPVGGLGYIGESRVLRAAGKPGEAIGVLEHLLSAKTPQEKAAIAEPVRVLAVLERLESMLITDPAGAQGEAEAALKTTEFRKHASAAGQAAWLVARAMAMENRAGEASVMLRAEPVVAAAPAFERLRLIAGLEADGGELLTVDERLAWAALLRSSRRAAEAVEAYRRAEQQDSGAFRAEHWSAYGRLLLGRGEHAEASERFQNALDLYGPEDAERVEALSLLAQARYAAADEASGEETRRVLMDVVRSDADDRVRRAALRRWVHLAEGIEPGAVIEALRPYESLLAGDEFLGYALVRHEWLRLDASIRGGSGGGVEAEREARRLVEELDSILVKASGELRSRAALLGAAIRAGQPLEDKRGALSALDGAWEALVEDTGTVGVAVGLRLRLLMDLGLTDAAHAMLAEGSLGVAVLPSHRVRLAEALGERYRAGAEDAKLRREVVSLVTAALAGSAGDGEGYGPLARRGAEALIRVEAFSDAQLLIESLRTTDHESSVEAALLEAAAMRGRGDTDGAIATLEEAVHSHPDSPVLHKALGDIRASLGQHETALDNYRAARRLCGAGSEPWWEATLGLVGSLDEAGRGKEAQDVLRVAAAIYPPPEKPTLRSRIDAARRIVDAPADTSSLR